MSPLASNSSVPITVSQEPALIVAITFFGSVVPAFFTASDQTWHRGVGVERVALGIDVLGLELLDDRLRGRLVARIGTEGEQRAFAVRTGDRGELLVGQRVAGHQHGLQALIAHLAQDQAGFLMIAADIDQIDVLAPSGATRWR